MLFNRTIDFYRNLGYRRKSHYGNGNISVKALILTLIFILDGKSVLNYNIDSTLKD